MDTRFLDHLDKELNGLRDAGLHKTERVIGSPQTAEVVVGGRRVINLCDLKACGQRAFCSLRKTFHQPAELGWGQFARDIEICGKGNGARRQRLPSAITGL